MRFMGQSIGLAMLGAVMATALPPKAMLALFAGLSTQNGFATSDFVQGMRDFFLISSGIGMIGTLTSLVRGREVIDTDAQE
jgi:hypothetical protein